MTTGGGQTVGNNGVVGPPPPSWEPSPSLRVPVVTTGTREDSMRALLWMWQLTPGGPKAPLPGASGLGSGAPAAGPLHWQSLKQKEAHVHPRFCPQ